MAPLTQCSLLAPYWIIQLWLPAQQPVMRTSATNNFFCDLSRNSPSQNDNQSYAVLHQVSWGRCVFSASLIPVNDLLKIL